MKHIIYKENGIYKTTTEENYKRFIQNAREICTWENFITAVEIIDYLVKWCKYKKEDFVVVESEANGG